MKTTIKCITVTILLAMAVTAYGQQATTKHSPEDKAKVEAGRLKEKLSLTDAQATKCEKIIKKYSLELNKTKQNTTDTVKLKTTREELIKKRNNEIKALLNPEQAASFEKWQAERRKHNGKAMKDEDKPKK